MLTRFKPSRARLEFEAVKGLAKDNLNFDFLVIAYAAFLSLCVLITTVLNDYTVAAASLVIVIGICITVHVLIKFKLIYPGRFKILYKRKK